MVYSSSEKFRQKVIDYVNSKTDQLVTEELIDKLLSDSTCPFEELKLKWYQNLRYEDIGELRDVTKENVTQKIWKQVELIARQLKVGYDSNNSSMLIMNSDLCGNLKLNLQRHGIRTVEDLCNYGEIACAQDIAGCVSGLLTIYKFLDDLGLQFNDVGEVTNSIPEYTTIQELPLSEGMKNTMTKSDITTVGQLRDYTKLQLLQMKGVGIITYINILKIAKWAGIQLQYK